MYVYSAGIPDENIFWMDESDFLGDLWPKNRAALLARFCLMFDVPAGERKPLADRATPAELRTWKSLMGFLYAARRLAIHNVQAELKSSKDGKYHDYGWWNGYCPKNTMFVVSNFNTGEVIIIALREDANYGEESYAGNGLNRTIPKYQRNVSTAK